MDKQDIILLTKEIDEHHQYTRTNIQLLVQWFIFFATANYVVFGLFAVKMVEGVFKSLRILWVATAIFVVVNLFGIVLCFEARRQFRRTRDRIISLSAKIQELTSAPSTDPVVVLPHADYSRVMVLMGLTLLCMLITWAALAVIAGLKSVSTAHPELFFLLALQPT